jgi:hypothetical protein
MRNHMVLYKFPRVGSSVKRRPVFAHKMEDNDVVVVKNDEKEWTVRCAILCACSAVLDGILRDSDPDQSKVLNMEDVSVVNVETFLSLATMTSHDRNGEVLTISDLSRMTVSAMPLVHKYDCKALLKILQHAQNEQPNIEGILAIIDHDQEASQWMSEQAKLCLVKHLFDTRDSQYPNSLQKRQRTEHEMKKLPHAILAKLFIFTMTDLKPKHLPSADARTMAANTH